MITVPKVIINPSFVYHRSMFLEFLQLKKLSLIRGQLSMTQSLTDKAVLKRHSLVQKFATTLMLNVVISKFIISSIIVRPVNHLIMGSPNVSLRNQKPQLPHPIQSLRKVNKIARHDWICSIPINVDNLQMELQGHPDPAFVQYLCQGLREGLIS